MKDSRPTHLLLALIMLAYLAAGVQYACLTPPWQAPDEPAHFNYVRYVAERGALPVLQMGDFPADYLARFTNPKNTPTMSIDPIRYEAWQPPLYYLVAAGVYRVAGGGALAGQLFALRLFSVALGALLIAVAYRAVATLAPGRTWLALGTAGFVAAVPMHVATTAAVNNDTLAELWVALVLWQLFALLRAPGRDAVHSCGRSRHLGRSRSSGLQPPESQCQKPSPAVSSTSESCALDRAGRPKPATTTDALGPSVSTTSCPGVTGGHLPPERTMPPGRGLWPWLWLGATLGLAGLTKLSTVVVAPLALAVLACAAWRQAPPAARLRDTLARLAAMVAPAALLLSPWLARNVAVYGIGDPLAFRWHARVVEGQLRTADWLAQEGWRSAANKFAGTAFHSFWGQFGWMGVPMDTRVYHGLTVLSGLAILGLLLRLGGERHRWPTRSPEERTGLAVLASLVVLSAASFGWYNLTFLQPQGRYLFPALVPIGVFLAAGWGEIARRARRPLAAGLLVAAAALLAARSALHAGPWDKWTLAGLVGGGGGFGLAARLPERWALWLYPLPYLLLLALDFYCLYAFVLPALS